MKLRRRIKNFIGKLIEKIERYELQDIDIDENDISKKIIDSHFVNDMKVMSDSGLVDVTEVHKTQPYTVYEIEFLSGKRFECADNHIIYLKLVEGVQEVFVKNLIPGMLVCTSYGSDTVAKITKLPYKLCMYDLTVNDANHRYYTSEILSHNTTTIAAFISWMMLFSIDKNILLASNKLDTVKEILDKIINIFKGLPFFLKPGTEQWGKLAIKLDNGCKIVTTATTNTASIGFTIHLVLLDEFAHIPENIVNNFWRSVYPTLSSSKVSQCIITSTPNGTTNKFYDIWCAANEIGENRKIDGEVVGKKSSWIPIRTDYFRVPGRGQEWADQMRKDFGEEEFAQEFELQFNKNSKMLMKPEAADYISRMITTFVPKQIYIQNQYLNDPCLIWHPDFDPNNIDPNDKFLMLVDLAEGNGETDEKFASKKRTPDSNSINIFRIRPNSIANIRRFSNISCKITDCFRFEQIGRYSCNTEDEVYCARVCSALSYNLFHDSERDSVRVAVEMNFNGKSFFEEFKRHQQYSGATIVRTYHTKPIPGEKQRKRYGIKTTQNKESYCIKGNKMLSKHRIIIHCKDTFEQMKAFGYLRGKLTGIACHDDLSMPVFNHIPRMLDESSFVSWLQDYLFVYKDQGLVYRINSIIQQWAMENPDMSDGDFAALYGLNEMRTNPYQQPMSTNPYSDSGGLSPYANQGGGLSPYAGQGGLSPYADQGSYFNPYSNGVPMSYR